MSQSAEIPKDRLLRYAIPVGIVVVLGLLGRVLMPVLLTKSPIALIAISPVFPNLVLASPSVDTWLLYAVGVPRHFAPDPFMYFLGRDFGPAAIEWIEHNSPSNARLVRGAEKLFSKVGVFALLVFPELVVSTLAGAAKIPFPVFVVFNVLGTVATITVAKFFGVALEQEIAALTAFFKQNLVVVTVAFVAFFALLNWWSNKKSGAVPGDSA